MQRTESGPRFRCAGSSNKGTAAPSGGNTQPWKFVARGTSLLCLVDDRIRTGLLDFDRRASFLALGAAAENMVLAAGQLGIHTGVDVQPDPHSPLLAATVTFVATDEGLVVDPLAAHIAARATNRCLGPQDGLGATETGALVAAGAGARSRLAILDDPTSLNEMADILGRGDRVRMLSPTMHEEMMAELRFTPEEAESTRDGLDLATLELSGADAIALRMLRSQRVISMLRRIGGGRALEQLAHDAMAGTAALALLIGTGRSHGDYFRGGRVMQRVWLTAHGIGLGVQPYAAHLYLFARVEDGTGAGLTAQENATLRELMARHRRLFELNPGETEMMLLRLAKAPPPTGRSLRRPVDEVLQFEH